MSVSLVTNKRPVNISPSTNEGPKRKRARWENSSEISALPGLALETQVQIFDYLTAQELKRCLFVSKTFNNFVNSFFYKPICLLKASSFAPTSSFLFKVGQEILELGYLDDAKEIAQGLIRVGDRVSLTNTIIDKLADIGRKEEARLLLCDTLKMLIRDEHKLHTKLYIALLKTASRHNLLEKEKIVKVVIDEFSEADDRAEVLSGIFPLDEATDILLDLYSKKPERIISFFVNLFRDGALDWSTDFKIIPFFANNLNKLELRQEDGLEGAVYRMFQAYNQSPLNLEVVKKYFSAIQDLQEEDPADSDNEFLSDSEDDLDMGEAPAKIVRDSHAIPDSQKNEPSAQGNNPEAKIQKLREDLEKIPMEKDDYKNALLAIAHEEIESLKTLSEETLSQLTEYEAFLTHQVPKKVTDFLLQKIRLY